MHYQRVRKHGTPEGRPPKTPESCDVKGCDRTADTAGLCETHYARKRRTGTAGGASIQAQMPWPANLLGRLEVQSNGCVHFTGQIDRKGYGVASDGNGRKKRAHRLMYELMVGPIPDGRPLDHRCHNEDPDCPGGVTCLHRRCLNPGHLEPSTTKENLRRGKGPSGINYRKTHCIRGHEFTDENTYVTKRGARSCRTCHREGELRRWQTAKAAA